MDKIIEKWENNHEFKVWALTECYEEDGEYHLIIPYECMNLALDLAKKEEFEIGLWRNVTDAFVKAEIPELDKKLVFHLEE